MGPMTYKAGLTIPQVAARCEVSRLTVDAWVQRGLRVGGVAGRVKLKATEVDFGQVKYLISEDDLAEFLRATAPVRRRHN